MTTKIRYSVQTSNKYAVIDPDKSEEETENKDVQELNKTKSLNETKVTNNNVEKKVVDEKSNSVSKKESTKKVLPHTGNVHANSRPDGYKYPIPSLNDVLNEKGATPNYQDNNYYGKGNLRSKYSRSRRIGYSSSGTNTIGKSNYYRGSRNYDYKPSNDRRGYNNSYSYKPDYREKGSNEYLEGIKSENYKREHAVESKGKSVYNTRRMKDEVLHKKQERKLNKTKSLEIDSKKKKNENTKEKDGKIADGSTAHAANDSLGKIKNKEKNSERVTEEPVKADHSKKKTTMNLYEYILYEGTSIDKLPGFHRRYRNYNRNPEDMQNSPHINSSNGIPTSNGTLYKPSNQYSTYGNNIRSYKNKPKSAIDENILKNRDPPNIDDTRAFPSLTSK